MKTRASQSCRVLRVAFISLVCLVTVQPLSQAATWETRSPMPTGRYGPQVAAIGTTIYVVGGQNGTRDTAVVEAYNTLNNSWSTLAPLPNNEGRYQACVMGVINGKLYLPGGWRTSPALPTSSLLIYNPANNSWSQGAAMPILSGDAVGGVINDKLYVLTAADGYSGWRKRLHVYDPTANTWTEKAQAPNYHSCGVAGVINGKLYVAGGGSNVDSAALDVYDPENNTWSTLAPMPTARTALTGGVVDGKLYVVGGGRSGGTRTVEAYDPASNTWSTEIDIPTARSHAGAAVVGKELYVIGGHDGARVLNTVEMLVQSRTWQTRSAMPTGRYGPQVAAIGTTIYVVGGQNGTRDTAVVEAYDTLNDLWSTLAPLPNNEGRYQACVMGVISGKLYLPGGWRTSPALPTSSLLIYNPANNTWSQGAAMPILSGDAVGGVINGKLYVLTAADGYSGWRKRLHVYDPAVNTWTEKAQAPNYHSCGVAGVINGKLYVAGGGSDTDSAALDVYDPANNTWSTLAPMPTARTAMAGGAMDGKLYVVGGGRSGGTRTVEVYDPVSNTWSTEKDIPTARAHAGAAVVGEELYVIGGHDGANLLNNIEVLTTKTPPEPPPDPIGDCEITEIPAATITLDGNVNDWGAIPPLVQDPAGDSSQDNAGDDIKAIYVAKDANNLYLRMDLWENVNTDFSNWPPPYGGRYSILVSNNGPYPALYLGIAYGRNPDPEGWSLGYNGASAGVPPGLEGPSFVGVAGSHIEVKVPLQYLGTPLGALTIQGDSMGYSGGSADYVTLDETECGNGPELEPLDDFEATRIDTLKWTVTGGSKWTLSQAGGLLLANGPPAATYAHATSVHRFGGDAEFVLNYRDFSATATTFANNCPSIGLQVADQRGNFAYIFRGYTAGGHQIQSNAKILNVWKGSVVAATSTTEGLLRVVRSGSTITTFYDDGSGWRPLGIFEGFGTAPISVSIDVYTGDNGTFHAASESIRYRGNMLPPAEPSITANGSPGPITIRSQDALRMAIAMTPGGDVGTPADWWVVLVSPFGPFSYNIQSQRWTLGLRVSAQQSLRELTDLQILNQGGLPAGTYTVYFAIDYTVNGRLDTPIADSVRVNITQ